MYAVLSKISSGQHGSYASLIGWFSRRQLKMLHNKLRCLYKFPVFFYLQLAFRWCLSKQSCVYSISSRRPSEI